MSKKHYCQACSNERFGVKTRLPIEHTCERGNEDKGPREHKIKITNSETGESFEVKAKDFVDWLFGDS